MVRNFNRSMIFVRHFRYPLREKRLSGTHYLHLVPDKYAVPLRNSRKPRFFVIILNYADNIIIADIRA